eukprot:scaffold36782_cov66-Phaeocystis_antarctica.AAC.8
MPFTSHVLLTGVDEIIARPFSFGVIVAVVSRNSAFGRSGGAEGGGTGEEGGESRACGGGEGEGGGGQQLA